MGQTNFHLSYSEDTIKASNHCDSCGASAEIHLALLEGHPQRSGSYCLSCGEALIHDLQRQYALFGHPGTHSADTAHPTFAHVPSHHDENEQGIIYWEGHGWSSDGPFAGA
ncbi:MAG TPA: hypothetical protein VF458_17220 [Ktedonobacteraceae bacterium]